MSSQTKRSKRWPSKKRAKRCCLKSEELLDRQEDIPANSCHIGELSNKRVKQIVGIDLFSKIPDEIIESNILQRLPLIEAVRTSILSRRWRKLWTQDITPNLFFLFGLPYYDDDDYNCLGHPIIATKNELRSNFARSVFHLLESHYYKSSINKLSIYFDLKLMDFYDDINRLVEFALRKGTTWLDLVYSPAGFPFYSFFGIGKFSSFDLSNLRHVCLSGVPVSSEVLHHMLSSACPSLEDLSLSKMSFSTLNISGRSLRLRRLQITECRDSQIAILLAPNLKLLVYDEFGKHFPEVTHAPMLSRLNLGPHCCADIPRLAEYFMTKSSYLSKLKRLILDFSNETIMKSVVEGGYPLEFPQFMMLEELEVKLQVFTPDYKPCLLWPVVLIKAAPILETVTFELDVIYYDKKTERRPYDIQTNVKILRKAAKKIRHQHLKWIELLNYTGSKCERELCKYVLGTSKSLREVVVVPDYNIYVDPESWKCDEKQLTKMLPTGVNLVVQ